MKVAATGHRPQSLPCRFDEEHPWLTKLKSDLNDWLIEHKPELVITGMALGWDTWVAEECIKLEIPIHCYIPFKDQGSKWSFTDMCRYENIIKKSDKVFTLSQEYYPECFLKRDRAMVDSADFIIALLDPEIKHGGTRYTYSYANKQKKPTKNFWRPK